MAKQSLGWKLKFLNEKKSVARDFTRTVALVTWLVLRFRSRLRSEMALKIEALTSLANPFNVPNSAAIWMPCRILVFHGAQPWAKGSKWQNDEKWKSHLSDGIRVTEFMIQPSVFRQTPAR
jgi:hypothetical protein